MTEKTARPATAPFRLLLALALAGCRDPGGAAAPAQALPPPDAGAATSQGSPMTFAGRSIVSPLVTASASSGRAVVLVATRDLETRREAYAAYDLVAGAEVRLPPLAGTDGGDVMLGRGESWYGAGYAPLIRHGATWVVGVTTRGEPSSAACDRLPPLQWAPAPDGSIWFPQPLGTVAEAFVVGSDRVARAPRPFVPEARIATLATAGETVWFAAVSERDRVSTLRLAPDDGTWSEEVRLADWREPGRCATAEGTWLLFGFPGETTIVALRGRTSAVLGTFEATGYRCGRGRLVLASPGGLRRCSVEACEGAAIGPTSAFDVGPSGRIVRARTEVPDRVLVEVLEEGGARPLGALDGVAARGGLWLVDAEDRVFVVVRDATSSVTVHRL